jgi:dUTP pyrophosphatase
MLPRALNNERERKSARAYDHCDGDGAFTTREDFSYKMKLLALINIVAMTLFYGIVFFILCYFIVRRITMIFYQEPLFMWRKDPAAILPHRSTPGAVGYDLFSPKDIVLFPGETTIIDTGFVIIPPFRHYVRIDSRSSIALQGGHVCTHTVDPDYRGTIKVFLRNAGTELLKINRQTAVAQFTLCPFTIAEIKPLKNKPQPTERNDRYKNM